MIDTSKYINIGISKPKEMLLKELKTFERINEIKFDMPHTIESISCEYCQDPGDDQNTFTSKILKLKVGELIILISQEYSDYSCDFSYTTSLNRIIDID